MPSVPIFTAPSGRNPRATIRSARLVSWTLRRSQAWRVASWACALIATIYMLVAIVAMLSGHRGELGRLSSGAAVVVAWVAGTCIGWWSASNRAQADRLAGIDVLASAHGIPTSSIFLGRACATTTDLAALVLVFSSPVLLLSVAAATSLRAAIMRLGSVLALGVFAIGVGLVGGGLATLCGKLAPQRGRTLFAFVVFVPLLIDSMPGQQMSSVAVTSLLGSLLNAIGTLGMVR